MTKVTVWMVKSLIRKGYWFSFECKYFELTSNLYKTKASAERAAKHFAKKHNFEITKWGEA